MPNISDLAPEPTECGTVVIRGPKGDPGEPGPPGETNVLVRDPITADGTGTEGDPYVISLQLSADPTNNLSLAADGSLYSPVPDGSETIVTGGDLTAVTGTGTVDDPYVIASTATAADLGAITSVTGIDGVTALTDGTNVTVSADISPAEGNQLSVNSDGGLFVTAQTAIGDNTYLVGDGLKQSGSGTAEDPYILSVSISTDEGNALVYGADGGLYVPASADIGDWIDLPYDTENWTVATVTPQYRLIGDKQAAIRFSLTPNEGFQVHDSRPITLPAEIVPAQGTWKNGVVSASAYTGSGTIAPASVRFDISATDGVVIVLDQRGFSNWIGLDTVYWLD